MDVNIQAHRCVSVGWAHFLRRTSDNPALAPAIDTIVCNAQDQTKLIEDLLDMSRIMAGKVGLTLARDRLAEIVTAAADALQPVARARGVTLAVATDDVPDAWVTCDAARLQQVVTNLIENGIKFARPEDRVSTPGVDGLSNRGQPALLPTPSERTSMSLRAIPRHPMVLVFGPR